MILGAQRDLGLTPLKQMKVIKHTIDTTEDIQILPLSDLHIGDPHADIKFIKECIKKIEETPNMFTVIDGDCLNCGIVGSKSCIYTESVTPMEALEMVTEMFQGLADSGKILAVLPGNHEERIFKTDGVDMTRLMAAQLGIRDLYSPTSALLFLKFGTSSRDRSGKRKQVYTVYINHGNGGGGRRAGSKINALEDMSRVCIADIYVMGHTHQPASFRKQIIVPNHQNGSVTYQELLFVNTAAFLDWSGSYGDRGGYQPNSKQPPIITLSGSKHEAKVTI